MISADSFDTWVQEQQEIRSVRAHVRNFLTEKRLTPTATEVKSLMNGIYNRLRKCKGQDYPTIDYVPQPNRAQSDGKPIQYAAGKDLATVSDAVTVNGFALPETTQALNDAHSTHITANVAQQKALGGIVKSFTAELNLKDVKLSNAEELARLQREAANDLRLSLAEARKDKTFFQSMIVPKSGSGNDVI